MTFRKLILLFICIVIACAFSLSVKAQKYYFQHYDIGDGLIQSQVTSICQDKNKQIWLTTLGGINCFDSKQFSAFTIDDGLTGNSCFSLTQDKKGIIWVGGERGVTEFGIGGLKNYVFQRNKNRKIASMLSCDSQNNIWAMIGKKLCKLNNGQWEMQTVVSDDESITNLKINKKGEIFAAVYGEGIYKLENNQWRIFCSLAQRPKIRFVGDFVFDNSNPDLLYFITNDSLYSANKGVIKSEFPQLFKPLHPAFTCLLLDNENGLWIGTDNGACLLKNGAITYFNDKNGFTNVRVFCMFKDIDNQIWFGTDGSGLFKYRNDTFLVYDKTQGLENEVVMALAKGKNNEVYIGSNGGKLLCYKNNSMIDLKLPREKLSSLRVNCLYKDSNDNLWIGTDNSGLWVKKGDEYSKIYTKSGSPPFAVFTTIYEDSSHNLWFTSSNGCFYLEGNALVRVTDFNYYCSSIIEIGKDSILIGTLDGVRLIRNKNFDNGFSDILPKEPVNCLAYSKPFVIAGTNEKGVAIYNLKTKSKQTISRKTGLNSNIIYNLLVNDSKLWIGTGRGVSIYSLAEKNNSLQLKAIPVDGPLFESNQNAILKVKDDIWIGTTHGANIYPIIYGNSSSPVPKIVIENVQTYTSNKKNLHYSYFSGYKLPGNLSLPSSESHIAIEFQAIEFNAPIVLYQYMLTGLDKAYSKPSQNSYVDYPNLPPGDYTFKVKSAAADSSSTGVALYQFTVTPEFYETVSFKLAVVLLLLSTVFGFYLYKSYANRRKLNFIHQLKLQEQENVRRQTGEDFHDDLGNKLTRINMLSELLDKKMSPELETEKKLTEQIRSSAIEMYMGTKNILWALNPENDHLDEIIKEIEKFGHCLFENMNIVFTVSSNDQDTSDIKLPLGYSHNITLIFKELMNNILKHSQANIVTFSYELTSYNRICLAISDNGKGYNIDGLHEGNGLKNIQNRAKKINGEIIIDSCPGKGTVTKLIMLIA
ncbi:MAG TPA: two-component regulator propeller domain-containing protein [Mucilaginibacter sp.]|jgi:signal transduction histidine kinase/ligand-binding sensor domain-containing protein